jgi:hypothetical protein
MLEGKMENRMIMQAKGTNGTLELWGDRIRIVRGGLLSGLYGSQSTIELPLRQITAVEFKRTAGGLAGYLAFHDCEGTDTYKDLGVSFLLPQQRNFGAVHQAIEEQLTAIRGKLLQDPNKVVYIPRDGALV